VWKPPKHYDPCPGPGCTKVGDFCRGCCGPCYRIMRAHCIANGSWGNGDHEFPAPEPPPKWEYTNDDGERQLAEAVEAQERELKLKSEES
jgi:hypothetical protein